MSKQEPQVRFSIVQHIPTYVRERMFIGFAHFELYDYWSLPFHKWINMIEPTITSQNGVELRFKDPTMLNKSVIQVINLHDKWAPFIKL